VIFRDISLTPPFIQDHLDYVRTTFVHTMKSMGSKNLKPCPCTWHAEKNIYTVVAKIIRNRTVRFFNVLKEVSSAYQGFIYLIQNTSKTVILW